MNIEIEMNELLDAMEEAIMEGIADAVHEAAHLGLETAVELCPKETGDLANSIQANTDFNKDNFEATANVETNSDHAAYVEFGTGPVGKNTPVENKMPGVTGYKEQKWRAVIPGVGVRWVAGQPAQPFMYPAAVKVEKSFPEIVNRRIKERLENTGG